MSVKDKLKDAKPGDILTISVVIAKLPSYAIGTAEDKYLYIASDNAIKIDNIREVIKIEQPPIKVGDKVQPVLQTDTDTFKYDGTVLAEYGEQLWVLWKTGSTPTTHRRSELKRK